MRGPLLKFGWISEVKINDQKCLGGTNIVLVSLALGICLIWLPLMPAHAEYVYSQRPSWDNASLYPKKVRKLLWNRSGLVLSHSPYKSVKYGNWHVSMQAKGTIASKVGVHYAVSGLFCLNQVVGKVPCYYLLHASPFSGRLGVMIKCSLVIGKRVGEKKNAITELDVVCPTHVQ